ncbi:MAG: alpha/beta hydrolase [Pseudomonadota bacterium]
MMYLLILLGVVVAAYLYANANPVIATRKCLSVASYLCGMRKASVLVDHYEWHYLDSDDGTGKPVVLLVHGYGADKESWLGYARLLTSSYRVIAPDLPGFGLSDRNVFDDYSPRSQAQRLALFCRVLNLRDLHVAGSSMGGYICSWFAIDHGHYVASLTLMNAAGVFGATASGVQQAAEAGNNLLLIKNEQDFMNLLKLLTPKPPFMPAFMRRYAVQNYLEHGDQLDTIFWQLAEAQQQDGLQASLSDINVPTLIVWGDSDQVIDVSCVDVFDEAIGDSETLIFAGKGHIPMFEAPVQTARRQKQLIERARSSSHVSTVS